MKCQLFSNHRNSAERVKTFVDWFIHSEHVEMLTSDRDSDFINEPERAARCHDAAEFGADGKTHAEVIQDWRDAFSYWLSDETRSAWSAAKGDRFGAAVCAYFDSVESWHEKNGSLWTEIG